MTEVFSNDNFLSELIIKITDSWIKEEKLVIQLNESDFSGLEQILRLKLGNKLKEGIEIKPFKGISKGFKIQKRILVCSMIFQQKLLLTFFLIILIQDLRKL